MIYTVRYENIVGADAHDVSIIDVLYDAPAHRCVPDVR
jgi:hypothetical protein